MSKKQNDAEKPHFILAQMEDVMRELRRISDADESLREHVRLLVLLRRLVNEYGAALLPEASSARGRILAYLQHHVGEIVNTEELTAVSGIQDSPRRIRELRKQGYHIISGVGSDEQSLAPNQYTLVAITQTDGETGPDKQDAQSQHKLFSDDTA